MNVPRVAMVSVMFVCRVLFGWGGGWRSVNDGTEQKDRMEQTDRTGQDRTG